MYYAVIILCCNSVCLCQCGIVMLHCSNGEAEIPHVRDYNSVLLYSAQSTTPTQYTAVCKRR